jgi:hypothetical protein
VRPELATVPLQPRANTSPFWIMLLLSLGVLEHGMINAGHSTRQLSFCTCRRRRQSPRRPDRRSDVGSAHLRWAAPSIYPSVRFRQEQSVSCFGFAVGTARINEWPNGRMHAGLVPANRENWWCDRTTSPNRVTIVYLGPRNTGEYLFPNLRLPPISCITSRRQALLVTLYA